MLAAFVFKHYYMWGIKDNFRGLYEDFEQLETMLSGTEEYCFLETLDLETLEFHRYEWEPRYTVEKNVDPVVELDPSTWEGQRHINDGPMPYKLVRSYTNGKTFPHEVIPFHYDWLSNTVNLDAKMKFYAGHWKEQ